MLYDEIHFRKEGWEKSGVGLLIQCLNSLNMTFIYRHTYALPFELLPFMTSFHSWPLDQDLILINCSNWTITISNEMPPLMDVFLSEKKPLI